MSSAALSTELEQINDERLSTAIKAFLSVNKSLTIRRGKVVGEQQLKDRLRRAIAAYKAGTAF